MKPQINGIVKEELTVLQPYLTGCNVELMTELINSISDRVVNLSEDIEGTKQYNEWLLLDNKSRAMGAFGLSSDFRLKDSYAKSYSEYLEKCNELEACIEAVKAMVPDCLKEAIELKVESIIKPQPPEVK